MAELRFTESHEWIKAENGIATIGITRYAADQLGDIVHVELPQTGKRLDAGGEAAVVESVKAASEIYTPLAGEVTEANRGLESDLSRINSDPEQAWFFRVRMSEASQLNRLMTRQQYDDYLKGL
ncbi:MAG: glycine cleavage system protein GcvH [Alphaproteobacteria bacterium]|nr:glycine cleavage system protein GcvH [Alphaproteobacteria bacterium]